MTLQGTFSVVMLLLLIVIDPLFHRILMNYLLKLMELLQSTQMAVIAIPLGVNSGQLLLSIGTYTIPYLVGLLADAMWIS